MTETPWEPPLAGTEAEQLVGALDRLRTTFRWKADGLDAQGLSVRVGASALTLGSLLTHLASVEDHVFTVRLTGEPMGEPWASFMAAAGAGDDGDPIEDADPVGDEDSMDGEDDGEDPSFSLASIMGPDDMYALWDGAVARSHQRLDAALQRGGLDQLVALSTPDGEHPSLRRLLCDLVEEYGRHTGHADLLREAVDGRVGEDPPPGWVPVSGRDREASGAGSGLSG
jgi:hypothetical protein